MKDLRDLKRRCTIQNLQATITLQDGGTHFVTLLQRLRGGATTMYSNWAHQFCFHSRLLCFCMLKRQFLFRGEMPDQGNSLVAGVQASTHLNVALGLRQLHCTR